MFLRSALFDLDQGVFPIVAAVDHVDLVRLRVAEYEEMMVEQIHLHDGLLHVHRLEGKALALDDRIDVVLLRDRRGERLDGLRLEPAVTESALELRLLLANLAFEFLDDEVECSSPRSRTPRTMGAVTSTL